MMLTLNDIDLPPNIEGKLIRVVGEKCSIQKFMEMDPDEWNRSLRLSLSEIELVFVCVAKVFYPFSHRKTTVWDMLNKEDNSITCFSTGCPIMDRTLGGGVRLGQLTEIYGESGCGKTQLCVQMSLEIQRTFRARGQEAKVVYINTESQIEKIDKRLRHMSYYRAKSDKPFNIADARCLQQTFFDNIYLDVVRHYRHLEMTLIDRLPTLLKKDPNVRLIIIDSLAALFRSEDIMFQHQVKAKTLQYFGFAMHTLCHRYNIAIICINQVQTNIVQTQSSSFSSNRIILGPALGLTWACLVHCRIHLTRTEKIEERHSDSQQSQIVFDEQSSKTNVRNNVVHLRSLSIDFCYHIPKSNHCHYYIIDRGVFAPEN